MHGLGGRPHRTAELDKYRRMHDLVRLRMAGDANAMLKYFVEDVELNYNCSKTGLFPPGQWRGQDALRENLRRTDIDYEPLDAEIQDALVDGDRTALRWTSQWRHRATGRIYRMDMAHFLRWRNDRVAQMTEFIDHHGVNHGADMLPRSFEELLDPPGPGLRREEIAARLLELGNFSPAGPDAALFRRYCAKDVICEFVGDRATIFYAGRHRGVDALVNIFQAIAVDFEQFGRATPDMVIDGGRAAVRRRVEWRHRGTGRRGIVELADFMRFTDGNIIEMVEFRDSIALLQMQG